MFFQVPRGGAGPPLGCAPEREAQQWRNQDTIEVGLGGGLYSVISVDGIKLNISHINSTLGNR